MSSFAEGPPIAGGSLPLKQFWREIAFRHANSPALVSMHQMADQFSAYLPPLSVHAHQDGDCLRWTHGQLYQATEVLADNLRARGVCPGQIIGTILFNSAEWLMLLGAAILMDCTFVPLNARAASNMEELAYMLRKSKAQVLVVSDSKVAAKISAQCPEVTAALHLKAVVENNAANVPSTWLSFSDICDPRVALANGQHEGPESDHPALLVFTSGTTSLPKCTIYSKGNFLAASKATAQLLQLETTSRVCCHMPNHHIGGISMTLSYLVCGGSVVFPSPSFDPAASIEAISVERCTNLPVVPAMIQAMASHPDLKSADTTCLREIQTGATTILPEHLHSAYRSFGCKFVSNSFAATEGVPITGAIHDASQVSGSVPVGKPAPGIRLRICAAGTRELLPRGERGEIHVNGPQIISGYLEGASAKSFYDDDVGRWYITGDAAFMDDQENVTILGRYKDLIIRGGENIAPAAIEAVLEAKMGITAQIVGIPNEISGEIPVAVIQPREGQAIDLDKIRRELVSHVGPPMVPDEFFTLADFSLEDYPRTSSGKVRKVDLQRIVREHNEQKIQKGPNGTVSDIDARHLMTQLWSQTIGIDPKSFNSDTRFDALGDSLTAMRLRSAIQRQTGCDIGAAELEEAGTLESQSVLLDAALKRNKAPGKPDWQVMRAGPPGADDISFIEGDLQSFEEIREHVSSAIAPHGFSWDADVEDLLPSWDLGHAVFGSVSGSRKVNFRATLATKSASSEQLVAAVRSVLVLHPMQRSLEIEGLRGGAPIRLIMRANYKWFEHSIQTIPSVDTVDDLTHLLHDRVHFDQLPLPSPSFRLKIANLKSTDTAGFIWSAEHSAFDGLSLYLFLQDLDECLAKPTIQLKPHVPYKLWADMYYSQRTSRIAERSVNRINQKLKQIAKYKSSIFPPLSALRDQALSTIDASQKDTFLSPGLITLLPDLVELRAQFKISPFILAKAAVALFFARKTKTATAVFAQVENGRSWPSINSWTRDFLPDCMDVAGPTLERTVQIVPIPDASSVQFMQYVSKQQDAEAEDVHAPYNLVRESLSETDRALFDAASLSSGLNYIPVRTKDGTAVFNEMTYHGTRVNGETNCLFFCGIESDGDLGKLWMRAFADQQLVSREDATLWTQNVVDMIAWMCDSANWHRNIAECPVL